MKLFYSILFILGSNSSFSQYDLDSLWTVWEDTSQPDSNRVNAINAYSWYGYLFTQPDSAFYFSQLAYEFGKSINDEESMVKSTYAQGISFYIKGEFENAINSYSKSLDLSIKINYHAGIGRSYNGIGIVYQKEGDYIKALESYEKSLIDYEISGDISGTASVLGNIGIVYKIQGNFVKAIEYYNKSLKIHIEAGDKQGTSSTLNNLGIIYFDQKDYDKALELYEASLKLDREMFDTHGEALTLNNIGSVYLDTKDFTNALKYYNKALLIKKELGDQFGIGNSLFNLGKTYHDMEDYIKAMEYYNECIELRYVIGDKKGQAGTLLNIGELQYLNKNFKNSLNSNSKALTIAKEIGAVREIKDAAFNLYKVSKATSKIEEALEMYELYTLMKDSIDSEENQKEIFRQEFKLTYEKQAAADSVKTAEAKKVTDAELAFTSAQLDKEQTQRYSLYGGLALLVLFGGFIYNRFRVTQNQKEVIEEQKKNVVQAYEILEEKNTEILDSIKYAKRIQSAILPPDKLIKEHLPDSFILYKPKDIVAGDFYWLEHKEGKVLFAAADCTGHGVPGAMVSVVCNNGLNRSVREHNLTDPGKILDKTRDIIISEFEKSDDDVKDGMDIALCSIQDKVLQYAGAHNPLWIIRENELIEIKADKQPIGKYPNKTPYNTHTFNLSEGDSIYIFSDGYADQFGGEKNKKFKTKEFKALLLKIQDQTMENQKKILDDTFETWKGDFEQLDDVCIIGVRV